MTAEESHHEEASAADACFRCGYSLLGVSDDQPCPECGLLAGRSRRPSDELHYTRPGWLSRLAWGVRLILLALAAMFGWTFLREPVIDRIAEHMPDFYSEHYYEVRYHTLWIGLDVGAVLLLAGVVLLTMPEGYPPADRQDRWRRWGMRVLAVLLLGVMATRHVWGRVNWYAVVADWWFAGGRGRFDANLALFLASTAGLAPLPALLFWQLRSLAKRARSPHLAEHCAIVGAGNSLTLAYLAAFGVLLEFAEAWGFGQHWHSRSRVALGLIIAAALTSLLFALWNVYLLVRFSIAFSRTGRALRQQWQQSDRSLPA